MTNQSQDQAAIEWAESLGFKPTDDGMGHISWYGHGFYLYRPQILFFYTICQKAEREGQIFVLQNVKERCAGCGGSGFVVAGKNQEPEGCGACAYVSNYLDRLNQLTPPQDTPKQQEES